MIQPEPLFPKRSGILLHPTSFPSKFGIGDLGRAAYDFLDFLVRSNQRLWQILPLGPTGYGNSPYSSLSAFAGNEILIDLEDLVTRGYIEKKDLMSQYFNSERVDYSKAKEVKTMLLRRAFKEFEKIKNKTDFDLYCESQSSWLLDYSLYRTLKDKFNGISWDHWPDIYKSKDPIAISEVLQTHRDKVEFYNFTQYIFESQWSKLRQYAQERGIQIIGDIPIYVAYDSADTWANKQLFELNENFEMTHVSGCPPDYYSENGQLWGNPIYDWEYQASDNFAWWVSRVRRALDHSDIIRIDHFRGFEDYWSIPVTEKTAEIGEWIKGPGAKFLSTLQTSLGQIPVIAEDLGNLSAGVYTLRDKFKLPGMKILQFAFTPEADSENEYLPHNHTSNFVVYTGSHDNDTILGWYKSLDEKTKIHFLTYTKSDGTDPVWDMIKLAMSSVAHTVIITLQDLLRLDNSARMNFPGTSSDNWEWKYFKNDLNKIDNKKLRQLSEFYKRNKSML